MLHTPFYDVRNRAFCGPTAMSCVTGEPISRIRDVIRLERPLKRNGHYRPVYGVSPTNMLIAMDHLGWCVEEEMPDIDYTLPAAERMKPYRFKDFLHDHGNDGPFIVNVTNHYLAVSHDEVCDTFTCLPTPIERYLKRRNGPHRFVENWWRFARYRSRPETLQVATPEQT